MPGEKEPIETVTGALACPATVTTTWAEVLPASSRGTWTLSWPGKEENMGAEIPLKVTLAPPRVVTNLPLLKDENGFCEPSFKPVPKMAAIVPGERTLTPGAKLAAFTTPLFEITGAAVAGLAAVKNILTKSRTSGLFMKIVSVARN
jgi:hypothetical protein